MIYFTRVLDFNFSIDGIPSVQLFEASIYLEGSMLSINVFKYKVVLVCLNTHQCLPLSETRFMIHLARMA